MVWEQRTASVVMMTRLEEKSRVGQHNKRHGDLVLIGISHSLVLLSSRQIKCDQYWPNRGTETYGMVQVTLLDTMELATFCVRTFSLHKVNPSAVLRLHSPADPRFC